MAKRKIGEVLWLALQYAKQDRMSFAGAYGGDESNEFVQDALRDIRDIERVQVRLFGTVKSELRAKMDKMTPVNILSLLGKDLDEIEEMVELRIAQEQDNEGRQS